MARGNLKQGFYKPQHPEKYAGDTSQIVWRSSWELRFMRWCDSNPNVLTWASEGIVVPYFSAIDQKQHRYFVDFLIKVKKADGAVRNYLIEIKPDEQTRPPTKTKSRYYQSQCLEYVKNQEKWKAATEWASRNDCEFLVMTEHHLGLAKRGK